MLGLGPSIHAFFTASEDGKAWMAGTSPAMTHLRRLPRFFCADFVCSIYCAAVMKPKRKDIYLAGVCALAPLLVAVTLAVLITLTINLSGVIFGGAVPLMSGPFEMFAGAAVWILFGWLIALPGMAVFGYPVLRWMQSRAFYSWWAFIGAGGAFGGVYAVLLDMTLRFMPHLPIADGSIIAAGTVLGMMTGLAARWMITWNFFTSALLPHSHH